MVLSSQYDSPLVTEDESVSAHEPGGTENDEQEAPRRNRASNPDVDHPPDKAVDLPVVSSTLSVPLSTGDTDRGADNPSSEPESAVGQYIPPATSFTCCC